MKTIAQPIGEECIIENWVATGLNGIPNTGLNEIPNYRINNKHHNKIKGTDNLDKIQKGAVGATRPPCDNGWLPVESQIGLTGKVVAPNLYVAVALSGASQHISGCSNSKTIVAINKDPDANIFREAHFGVVGDWKQILPTFTGKVKELLSERT